MTSMDLFIRRAHFLTKYHASNGISLCRSRRAGTRMMHGFSLEDRVVQNQESSAFCPILDMVVMSLALIGTVVSLGSSDFFSWRTRRSLDCKSCETLSKLLSSSVPRFAASSRFLSGPKRAASNWAGAMLEQSSLMKLCRRLL